MAYEIKPNSGSLFVNEKKTSDTHPDFQGKIIISAELIRKLANQGGDFQFDVSGWKKTTGSGKNLLSLAIKEPYKKDAPPKHYAPAEIHEPTAHRSGALVETDRGLAFTECRQPAHAKATPDPAAYLAKLKDKIAAIATYPEFEELYAKIHSPEVWAVFKTNPAIAQEASSILSAKKGEFILATEPTDLSGILSALDVEIARLGLSAREHCAVRWDKTRGQLTPEELQIYLDELRSAKPVAIKEEFF